MYYMYWLYIQNQVGHYVQIEDFTPLKSLSDFSRIAMSEAAVQFFKIAGD